MLYHETCPSQLFSGTATAVLEDTECSKRNDTRQERRITVEEREGRGRSDNLYLNVYVRVR